MTAAASDASGVVRPSQPVVVLAVLVGVLALGAALAGLFVPVDSTVESVRPTRGDRVELYGEGIYRYDSAFKGAGNRGTDAVTLALALPLLAASTRAYRRASLRGALLLAGAFTWFAYVYASVALGAAYNELFLAYVALFSASGFGLVLAVGSLDARALGERLRDAPWAGVSRLMLAGGVVTAGVWLVPLVGAVATGDPPDLLDHYTTNVTDVVDLGVITPATLVAAWLLHRRDRRGWLVAFPLLVLLVALLPTISAQTVFQLEAGVSFAPGEIVGPIAGFLMLASIALWLAVRTLRATHGSSPHEAQQRSD